MNNMTREQFLTKIEEMVSIKMGKEYQVNLHQVSKNNGKRLNGILIRKSSEDLTPVIYLDYFFIEYQKGKSLEIVVDDLINIYMTNLNSVTLNVNEFLKYHLIKSKLAIKLINYEKNKELLVNVPHKKTLDLAVVIYALLDDETDRYNSILINNEHLKIWNISKDEIFVHAEKNSQKLLPANIKNMMAIMTEMIGEDCSENDTELDDHPMNILTNKRKLFGASCILYDGVIKGFSLEIGADVIILPSSLHEVILLPLDSSMDVETLRNMVSEVNETKVEPEDVLSDTVYLYEREIDEIRIM